MGTYYIKGRDVHMKIRIGNYPNKADFKPYYGQTTTDSEKLYALPLADPSESHLANACLASEINDADWNKPSAFSVNKKIRADVSASLV